MSVNLITSGNKYYKILVWEIFNSSHCAIAQLH